MLLLNYLEDRTFLSMFLNRGEGARGQKESVIKILIFLNNYSVPSFIVRTLHTCSHLILMV